MTPEQTEQIRFALSRPRYASWPSPPIVPGLWRDLEPDAALETLVSASDWLSEHRNIRNFALDWSIDRVRVRPLACYTDVLLVEFSGHAGYGRPGLINLVLHADGMALLDGGSSVIHGLNHRLKLQFETLEQKLDYLSLFMNWVHGDNGRFQPVGSLTELQSRLQPGADAPMPAGTLQAFAEVSPRDGHDGEPIAWLSGTVLYGTSLFRAVMTVYPDGLVQMLDDEVLVEDLPVREEVMAGPLLHTRL